MQQIGQVLVGGRDAGFKRVVRLKKEVLEELHEVRLALIEEHAGKSKRGRLALEQSNLLFLLERILCASLDSQSSLNDEDVDGLFREVSTKNTDVTKAEKKDVLPPISREMLLEQATQLQNRLSSDGQFVERFVDMQMMLREEIAKSSSLQKEVRQRLSYHKSMVKEVQQKVDRAESLQSQSADRIRRLETEFDDILHKLESSNASFTVKEAAMWQEKEKLDSCIAGLTTQLEQLEKKVIHLSDEVETGRAKEQNAIKELDEARSALRSQTEIHEQLEMKNDQLTSLVESLETERSELIDRIQMLELEVSETNVSLKNQEAKVQTLSSAMEENQSTLLKLNLEKQQLENMMSAERKASSESEALLRKEIDRQKVAVKEMTRSIEKNCLLKLVNDELQAKVRSIS
jgi:chromosome segregation ATPase